jgi:hypothetical protein
MVRDAQPKTSQIQPFRQYLERRGASTLSPDRQRVANRVCMRRVSTLRRSRTLRPCANRPSNHRNRPRLSNRMPSLHRPISASLQSILRRTRRRNRPSISGLARLSSLDQLPRPAPIFCDASDSRKDTSLTRGLLFVTARFTTPTVIACEIEAAPFAGSGDPGAVFGIHWGGHGVGNVGEKVWRSSLVW